jgi:thiol-disulfide isomerase/thioredoxin
MSIARSRQFLYLAIGLAAGFVMGCSSGDTPSGGGGEAGSDSGSRGLPTVAMAAPKSLPTRGAAENDDDDDDDSEEPDDADDDVVAVPKEGTPEWLVHEGTKLLLAPPPKTEDVEALKAHRQERNEKIIKLSQQAIEKTRGDKEKERVLNLAVHNLMEARLQQALTGERSAIDALYEDAKDLSQRGPKSKAAAEGVHTLVNFAYTMAKNSAGGSPKWIREFARQARRFAEGFPDDERRSLPLLFTAGRSCELAGLEREALDYYTLIQKDFPQNAFASRVAPIIRRLNLPGSPPRLGGPTLDGDQVSIDDLLGKVVLVVFWSAEVKPFLDQLPQLLELTKKHTRRGLFVLGVNLDQDRRLVEEFVSQHKIRWIQIFETESDKQGWNNPAVSFYGIMDVPALWLIDQNGNVVSTSMNMESLAAALEKLLDGKSESVNK